jgi:hypothetical protein
MKFKTKRNTQIKSYKPVTASVLLYGSGQYNISKDEGKAKHLKYDF